VKNIRTIIWLGWLFFMVLWNYGYPEATPFLDVLVAVLLSLLSLILLRIIKK
tara:strand:+ start:983 stop:1138 length:156 start_codon:yes stop_codon:yes gene_type:complete